jgi:hypothetical protein
VGWIGQPVPGAARQRFGERERSETMPYRQTVEFLRRRYAAAILRDDVDTAGRLRAQLDGIMNHTRAGRPGEGHPEVQARPVEPPAQLTQSPARSVELPAWALETAEERPAHTGGLRPRLHLVTPVTGLLERPARLVIASSRDPG